MTLYLLDSDAIIDVLKGIVSTRDFIRTLVRDGHTLALCDITTAEVWSGLHPQERPQGEQFLASLVYLPTSQAAARQAGQWRYAYARQGTTLSVPDTLIAAVAKEHRASVVTANVRHYPMDISIVALPRVRREKP